MTVPSQCTHGWVAVSKSFYTTFEGKRYYCSIPELYLNGKEAQLLVRYKQGNEEQFKLTSLDGFRFYGTKGDKNDTRRFYFEKWEREEVIILAGNWQCNGSEGEWFIEGFMKSN